MSLLLKILTGLGLFIIKAIHSNALLAYALKQHRVCSLAQGHFDSTVGCCRGQIQKKIAIHNNSGTKTLSSICFYQQERIKLQRKKNMYHSLKKMIEKKKICKKTAQKSAAPAQSLFHVFVPFMGPDRYENISHFINRHSCSFCTGISPHSMVCVVRICWHWGRCVCCRCSLWRSVIDECQPARSLVPHPATVPLHPRVSRHFYLHFLLLLLSVHLKDTHKGHANSVHGTATTAGHRSLLTANLGFSTAY